jgi:hypothetical protein
MKQKIPFVLVVVGLLAAGPGWVRASDEEIEFEVMDAGAVQRTREDALVWNDASHAWIERALSLPLPRTTPKGSLMYVIEHRNRTPVDDEPGHNLLGFDGGNLKIGLGLQYGLLENLDLSVYRLNGTVEVFDTWQFGARLQLLRETDQWLDAALLGGGTLFTIDGEEDDSGGYGGLLAGRSFGDHLYVSAGGLYHSASSSPGKTQADTEYSTAVLGTITAHLTPGFALAGELSAPVSGYEPNTVAWAGGIKWITHGHTFAVLASNTQYISLDGAAAGSELDADEVILGFSITREFALGPK